MHKRHRTQKRRNVGRYLLLTAYFVCAIAALLAALIASKFGRTTFSAWIYGVCAVLLALVAFMCLAREDTVKVAATVGGDWMNRINTFAEKPRCMNDPDPLNANVR